MHGTSVIPNEQIARLPVMRIDTTWSGSRINQSFEKRQPLLFRKRRYITHMRSNAQRFTTAWPMHFH